MSAPVYHPSTVNARHLTQDDLAERWRLSPRTLERWRSLCKGPPWINLGGRVVYRFEDVLAFEQARLRGQ